MGTTPNTQPAIVILDDKKCVERWSRAAIALTGIKPEFAVGKTLSDLIPLTKPDSDPLDDLNGGLVDERERLLIDGSSQSICIDAKSIINANGREAGFTVEMSLPGKARAERSDHRAHRMIEQTAMIGHWHLDLATGHVECSEGVYRLHAIPLGTKVTLRAALDSYIPADRVRVERALGEALANGESYHFRATIRRADGVLREVEVKGRPEIDELGDQTGLFGVVRDVTDEAEAHRRLCAARDEAKAAAEAHKELLATMSHEIRTPLLGIIGMIETLDAESDKSQQQKAFGAIQSGAHALLTVLNDALDHLKIESGQLVFEEVPFDLSDVATNVVELFKPGAEAKNVRVEFIAPETAPVVGDPVRVQQILSNFMSNAIKFTRDGTVRLRVAEEGRAGFLIEVIDTGIGIAKSVIDDLFTPFRQADASTSRHFGGSGLGLSISKRLAEAMNGTIGAESVPNEGSRFWVRLPLARPVGSAPTDIRSQKLVPLPRIAGRKPSILVMDDTETDRMLAEAYLQSIDANAILCENGLEGLKQLFEGGVDAILMDGSMPLLSGMETLRLIRQLPRPMREVPIIGFTADLSTSRHDDLLAAGMDGVLNKPLSSAAVSASLSPLLADRHETMRTIAPPRRRAVREKMYNVARLLRSGGDELNWEIGKLGKIASRNEEREIADYAVFMAQLLTQLGADRAEWLADLTLRILGENQNEAAA